jgi:hypothetical protein
VEEYVVNKVYGCQVIVTNCSVTAFEFQVLVEVPVGAIPVITKEYTKSHTIALDPYVTRTFEYFFYFPQAGTFAVYPANVSKFGTVAAVAKPSTFKVLLDRTVSKLEAIEDILQQGSREDILKFISTRNILNHNIFNFSDIYYLLKDKDFYTRLLDILRERRIFDYTTWSYSLYHGDHTSLREFLSCE